LFQAGGGGGGASAPVSYAPMPMRESDDKNEQLKISFPLLPSSFFS